MRDFVNEDQSKWRIVMADLVQFLQVTITTLFLPLTKIMFVRFVTYPLRKPFSRDVGTGFVMTASWNPSGGKLKV